MELLVKEEFEELHNYLAELGAGRVSVKYALQEDIQFLTDKFAEFESINEEKITEKFNELKNEFLLKEQLRSQLALRAKLPEFIDPSGVFTT